MQRKLKSESLKILFSKASKQPNKCTSHNATKKWIDEKSANNPGFVCPQRIWVNIVIEPVRLKEKSNNECESVKYGLFIGKPIDSLHFLNLPLSRDILRNCAYIYTNSRRSSKGLAVPSIFPANMGILWELDSCLKRELQQCEYRRPQVQTINTTNPCSRE